MSDDDVNSLDLQRLDLNGTRSENVIVSQPESSSLSSLSENVNDDDNSEPASFFWTPPHYPLDFCGGDGSHTVLSTGFGALLPFLSFRDATALRGTCKEARDTIAAFPFDELVSWLPGSIASWRACFPNARSVSLRYKGDLTDADLAHIAGLKTVDLYGAEVKLVTTAGYKALTSATTIDVSHVASLKSTAFLSFGNVETLRMAWCRQATVGDGAFAHLRSIRNLDMSLCWQDSFTDAGLRNLARRGTLKCLKMGGCTQKTITDHGVSGILEAGIIELDVSGCRQLSDDAFVSTLARAGEGLVLALKRLDVSFCPLISIHVREALSGYGVVVIKRISERERFLE